MTNNKLMIKYNNKDSFMGVVCGGLVYHTKDLIKFTPCHHAPIKV
ncbi:hypothetical protein [Moraxella bovis]|nr:hypothetical protein [Moraxella bovis]